MNVRDLEPKDVWNHFEDLNAVPRGSKKEERVIAFAKEFGEQLGLDTIVDKIGNVIIKKPATVGMENCKTVILQSHLDMVHQKNADTVFNFDTQGIETYIDGDWVKAKGTTLGADNGLGVAAIMAVLASKDLKHPPIEALLTIDEETGMTGAMNIEKEMLDGTILLNLDTEDDDEFSIGCAGGIDTNTSYKCNLELTKSNHIGISVTVNGLKGGHSGVDIDLDRGNANKIINRLFFGAEKYGLRLVEILGGSLRNAIPREATATIVVENELYINDIQSVISEIKNELNLEDPGLNIELKVVDTPSQCISQADTSKICAAIYACHNGVYRMSRAIKGLTETSSSLAIVKLNNGEFTTESLQRSSFDSGKIDVAKTVAAPFALMGCQIEHGGAYPGWSPNPTSEILTLLESKYKELFGDSPKVMAIHAGLECGLLGERKPGMDMISFGPTIKGAHSPDERASIKSTQKFWKFLKEILRDSPKA